MWNTLHCPKRNRERHFRKRVCHLCNWDISCVSSWLYWTKNYQNCHYNCHHYIRHYCHYLTSDMN